ncbi:unnamed protein product [Larinioides sclopetarius]|uniref:Uncharacterized protein n=1 Tax=Larinioides sclopetarius TaxID=280406 RepID=A0AAV2A486_9ARAC
MAKFYSTNTGAIDCNCSEVFQLIGVAALNTIYPTEYGYETSSSKWLSQKVPIANEDISWCGIKKSLAINVHQHAIPEHRQCPVPETTTVFGTICKDSEMESDCNILEF